MDEFDAGGAVEAEHLDVDGTNLRYWVAGPEDGRPVVLVHGGGLDAASVSWKRTMPALADDYRVYAPDLPGYGGSDPVPGDVTPTVDYYADVLSEFYVSLGLLKSTLVGFSLGGAVALGYTLSKAARVRDLVSVGSYGLGREVPGGRREVLSVKTPMVPAAAWWLRRRSRWATRRYLQRRVHPANLDAELLADVSREAERPDAGEAHRRFRRAEVNWASLRTDYTAALRELPVEALFVHGEDDRVVPPAWSRRASERVPVGERFTLADCGHWVPRECPEAFVARLRAWLE